jgi:hypothetical protein
MMGWRMVGAHELHGFSWSWSKSILFAMLDM